MSKEAGRNPSLVKRIRDKRGEFGCDAGIHAVAIIERFRERVDTANCKPWPMRGSRQLKAMIRLMPSENQCVVFHTALLAGGAP